MPFRGSSGPHAYPTSGKGEQAFTPALGESPRGGGWYGRCTSEVTGGKVDTVVATHYPKFAAGALVLLISTSLLSGCSSAAPANVPAGDYPKLSLAQSKSAPQLLRNTAVSRIPVDVVLNVGTDTDGSTPCLSKEKDPKGYIRMWNSGVDINIKPNKAKESEDIVAAVIKSFTDEGWMSQAITGSSASRHANLLTNGTATGGSVNLAQVRIEAVISGDKASAFIHIEATGACVVTGGTGSDEVTSLEKL